MPGPHLHQRDLGVESRQHQVLWDSHQRGPDLVSHHRHQPQDRETAALRPRQGDKVQHGLQETLQPLQSHHLENSNWPGMALPSTARLYRGWWKLLTRMELQEQCRKNTNRMIRDPSHSSQKLFCLLISRRYRSIWSHNTRLKDCLLLQAVKLLNSWAHHLIHNHCTVTLPFIYFYSLFSPLFTPL